MQQPTRFLPAACCLLVPMGLGLLLGIPPCHAGNIEDRWEVTGYMGMVQSRALEQGRIGTYPYQLGYRTTPLFGLRLGYYQTPHWMWEGSLGLGPSQAFAETTDPDTGDRVRGIGNKQKLLVYTGTLIYYPFLPPWTPFLSFGSGAITLLPANDILVHEKPPNHTLFPTFHAGIGIKAFISEWLTLRGEIRDYFARYHRFTHSLEITLSVVLLYTTRD